MHFILKTREVSGVAVGVKLVVQFEHHAQGILRARECLQVPRAFSEKIAALDDLEAQIRNVA
jgi:hypothetical protein